MILYGASGHAKVIIDVLSSNGITPEFIVDDNINIVSLLGIEVRRDSGKYDSAIISIGKNEVRKLICEKIKVEKYITSVHSSAIVSKHSEIGEGTVVMQGAIIQSCVNIGRHCIINTGATIDHDCQIEDFVHISPNATLCGDVKVGQGSWVGAGAVIKQGVTIGRWSIIGAGSVVIDNISDGVIAVGNKCRTIKQRKI